MKTFRHLAFATAALGLVAAGTAAAATTDASGPVLPGATAPAMPAPAAPFAGTPPVAPPMPAVTGVTAVPATNTPSANLLAHHGFVYQTRRKGQDTLGLLQIENSGGTGDVLTAWKCPIADQTLLVNGTGNAPVKQIDIPADGTVKLTADGDHLVLRNIHFKVQEGSMVPCSLTFQNAGLVGLMLYSIPDPRHKPTT